MIPTNKWLKRAKLPGRLAEMGRPLGIWSRPRLGYEEGAREPLRFYVIIKDTEDIDMLVIPKPFWSTIGWEEEEGPAAGRGEAKPQPQPQPLTGHSEIPTKKKLNARPAKDRKVRPVEEAQGPSVQEIELPKQQPEKPKRVVRWRCATGCGACCKLDKGPEFPTPDEVFADYPDHLQLYKSMIGPDGWCNNYDKSNRTCNIYQDWPFFCMVEPKVFDECFGVPRSKFDKEACSACVDNIKMVYGQDSPELGNFKRVIREERSKHEASMNPFKLLDTTNAGT